MVFDLRLARRLACASTLALAVTVMPQRARACACGCGLFDVGTASMFATRTGATVFLEYDGMDQNENWSGTRRASAADIPDKRIRTEIFDLGLQYQINRRWGAQIDVPYWNRSFLTTADTGSIVEFTHGAQGDVRLRATYTGISEDLSTGITFGLKLPTGDSRYANFDPDTEIGSGSTDLLIGAYHMGNLSGDGRWRYFAQVQWARPVAHENAYSPGAELAATAGLYHEGWRIGERLKIAPVAQLDGSVRSRDGGPLGDPDNTGYSRVFLTPGIEARLDRISLFADVGFQLYANVAGNQLVSRRLYRINLSYRY